MAEMSPHHREMVWSAQCSVRLDIDCRTAFNYFGDRNRIKNFSYVQPFLESEGTLTISTAMSTDFNERFVSFATSTFDTSGAT